MSNNEPKQVQTFTKKVSFLESTHETIVGTSLPVEKKEHIWYTIQDYDNFQQEASAKARRLRDKLAAGVREQRSPMNANDYIECIGIEKFLSTELQQEMATRKQIQIDSVISSQRFWNIDMLAYISESASQWAREKAHEFAMMYTDLSTHSLPPRADAPSQSVSHDNHGRR